MMTCALLGDDLGGIFVTKTVWFAALAALAVGVATVGISNDDVGVVPGAELAPAAAAAPAGADPLLAELMAEGQVLFTDSAEPFPCARCHGANGEGVTAPQLVGSDVVSADKSRIILLVMYGGQFMPDFGRVMSDRQIAAVTSYVRNSWGHDFGVVTEEDVRQYR